MALGQVVIVGASAAGLTAAETLRDEGFQDRILLVGEEAHAPYDRPPLSKQVLLGTSTVADTALTSVDALHDRGIELLTGTRAKRLDIAGRRILLEDGSELAYDRAILATGLKPRALAGQPAWHGFHTVRTLDHALELKAALDESRRVLVVGAGFMGCEIAASCRQKGLEVTLADPMPLPLQQQLGEEVGRAVHRLQREHGVDVRCGTAVQGFDSDGSAVPRVIAARLADDSRIEVDVVVVAIGSRPATDWLADSGLDLSDGIVCDACCRAAPDVYAAGDVASWWHRALGARLRLEHRMNATEQGIAAARNLLGAAVPFEPVPYVWTDLYDVKVQVWGCIRPGHTCSATSGDFDAARFTAAYRHGENTHAVLGWNAPRELRKARATLAQLSVEEAA